MPYELLGDEICQSCHKEKAVALWIGEGSTLDFVHSGGAPWCKLCIMGAQLDYAYEAAARARLLEREFRKILFERVEEAKKEVEQLRIQLAGCSVA